MKKQSFIPVVVIWALAMIVGFAVVSYIDSQLGHALELKNEPKKEWVQVVPGVVSQSDYLQPAARVRIADEVQLQSSPQSKNIQPAVGGEQFGDHTQIRR